MEKDKIRVGVIGCGNISLTYIPNLVNHFNEKVHVAAVADLFRPAAEKAAAANGIEKVYEVDELIADPDIDLIVNLTIPAAHYEINKKALLAGKHAYCEKPMAETLEQANELAELAASKGLYCVAAPDTFLGSGIQTVRKLIDDGVIGRVTGFTANLCQPGNELWHPGAKFMYMKGSGPMMDMGPYYVTALVSILGPIKQIICRCTCPRPVRMINGEPFESEVDTSYNGIIEFANGTVGNIFVSADVWQSQLPHLEIYGEKGAVWGTDPNMFTGQVKWFDGEAQAKAVAEAEGFENKLMITYGPAKAQFLKDVDLGYPNDPDPFLNMRGMGVADLACAILDGRKARLSADMSRHVVEALTGFKKASDSGQPYVMTTTFERPEAMPAGLKLWEVK